MNLADKQIDEKFKKLVNAKLEKKWQSLQKQTTQKLAKN